MEFALKYLLAALLVPVIGHADYNPPIEEEVENEMRGCINGADARREECVISLIESESFATYKVLVKSGKVVPEEIFNGRTALDYERSYKRDSAAAPPVASQDNSTCVYDKNYLSGVGRPIKVGRIFKVAIPLEFKRDRAHNDRLVTYGNNLSVAQFRGSRYFNECNLILDGEEDLDDVTSAKLDIGKDGAPVLLKIVNMTDDPNAPGKASLVSPVPNGNPGIAHLELVENPRVKFKMFCTTHVRRKYSNSCSFSAEKDVFLQTKDISDELATKSLGLEPVTRSLELNKQ